MLTELILGHQNTLANQQTPTRCTLMATNRTDPAAQPAHGADPQLLLDRTAREAIYASVYWQASCFGRNAAGVVHLAARLRYVGGAFGSVNTPTPFFCLLCKLLQLGPEPEIVDLYLEQRDFKYARVLGLMYTRLVAKSPRVYEKLEMCLDDFRKLVVRRDDQMFEIVRMDEFIEELLTEQSVLGITLPRLQTRKVLVETGALKPRVSALSAEDLAALDDGGDTD